MSNNALITTIFKPNVSPNFFSQTGWAVLRAIVGIMMIHNGLDKLGNIESFAEAYVEVIGLPFPIFFSYIAEKLGAEFDILYSLPVDQIKDGGVPLLDEAVSR
ncbi:MAG: DoxX family protein, partial [Cyanobacteriota bacterium]|nr:DoxX family protein [Cyanobacteriota bacterium]